MDLLGSFDGQAPLFPLPGVTLFPHVVQPFHMFEPRYRALADDVLNGDQYVAVGVLQPGHPELYDTKHAPVFDGVCLGHVTDGERLDDGRFNLIVNGLSRAKIVSEPATPKSYRVVSLELIDDKPPDFSSGLSSQKRSELISLFEHVHPEVAKHPAVRKTLETVLPLGVLCDFLVHVGDVETRLGAHLLRESRVEERIALVRQWLDAQATVQPESVTFPPKFSDN